MIGEFDDAATGLSDAIAVFRREGEHLGLILAVSRRGELAWRQGDLEVYAQMHAELLALGQASRSLGVITGATARLAHARLIEGDLEQAQLMARAALATSGESFMPIVNGYAFRTAGLVNLRSGHVAVGRSHLHSAIEAFELGTGTVGLGQAALCWIDLSRSYVDAGQLDDARRAADTAVAAGVAAGDPWVLDETHAHRASVAASATALETL